MKKLISTVLSGAIVLSMSVPVFADTPPSSSYPVNEQNVTQIFNSELAGNTPSENGDTSLFFVNDFRYRKVNVTTSSEWSSYKRVSDNVVTGSEGGSISANKSVTFGTEVSGSIHDLGISTNASVSSSVGYSLNVPANSRVYLGYRVKYKVEKGTREHYDIVTGKVLDSNKYTVKKPLYGEYKLINY